MLASGTQWEVIITVTNINNENPTFNADLILNLDYDLQNDMVQYLQDQSQVEFLPIMANISNG
jgi:hypothetical protein